MLPLSLGHLFVLAECKSPFTTTSPPKVSLGDVLFAAFVCSQPWQKARADLNSRGLTKWVEKWGAKCKEVDLVAEAQHLLDYFGYYFSCPAPDSQPGPECQTPHEWRVLSMLMADFNMRLEEALDLPLATATALWAANGERLGKLKFATLGESLADRVERSWQEMRRRDLALADEAKAAGVSLSEYMSQKLSQN